MTKVLPPKHDIFILAESLRQELGGKISIMGAYAAGKILIGSDATLPANFPLAFYFLFKEGEGTFEARVRLLGPTNNEIGLFNLAPAKKLPDQPLSLLLSFPLISLPTLGKYTVQAFLDEKQYDDEFSMARAPAPIVR